jgi:Tol biopolymer transport system component
MPDGGGGARIGSVRRLRSSVATLAILYLAVALPAATTAAVPLPAPVALPGNGPTGNAAISAEGRFVAIASAASNLVGGDTNGVFDAFVRDRAAGTNERVSVAADGGQANGQSGVQAISSDARFVVIWSEATNLVSGDSNRVADLFVRDRAEGTTERISVSSDGTQANAESAIAAITPEGRFVAFDSRASNLVPGDNDDAFDVFVRDRSTDRTELVGAGSGPAISADGRFVAFERRLNSPDGPPGIYVRDRAKGVTELVSVAADGTPGNDLSGEARISADGRYVVFSSKASNLVANDTNGPDHPGTDVFVRDRLRETTRRVSVGSDGRQADGPSGNPSLSSNGRIVAFTSWAPNLGPGKASGVYVHDLATGATELASVSTAGAPGDGDSYAGFRALSGDGRLVAFFSRASNLVPGDVNGQYDAFVRDREAKTTELASVARRPLLRTAPLLVLPKQPRLGKKLTLDLRTSVDGMTVFSGLAGCSARIGSVALKALSASFRESSVWCVWRLPVGAKQQTLRGRVSVTTPFGSSSRRFALRVAP